MSFFSDDRASELRELFFETSQELLQALNEQALQLEKSPTDGEIVRTIRRTIHTLKGDSAACGFKALSDLAHELEDVLTPEIAVRQDSSVAQVVLAAADVFEAMLLAFRENREMPDAADLHEAVKSLALGAVPPPLSSFAPAFAWSEYEQLVIAQGAAGKPVFNVGIEIDPQCPMRGAAMQMVRNVFNEIGALLVIHPEAWTDQLEIEAALASDRDLEWIARKCRIPAVASNVLVQPFGTASPAPRANAPAENAEPEMQAILDPDPADQDLLELPASLMPNGGAASGLNGYAPAADPGRTEIKNHVPHAISENILRVDAERIDVVLDLVGELIIARSMFAQTINEFGRRFPKDPLRGRFTDTLAHQYQVLNELQHAVMKIRMVPVEQLYRRLPRVVRDISKQLGKQVVLETRGQETDLDKSILDALAEPMSHLLRNALDHGLETPEERVAAGKPPQGCLRLNAYHQGNQIVLEVSDDGRGIDRDRVAAKALERGIVTGEELDSMSQSEVLDLIFESGFSTAREVTKVSGRGVGLDVVKAVLERMKGSVSVITNPGQGTTFQMRVPLTLAIIKALMFRVNQRLYAVPLGAVLQITRANESEIHIVDHHEVLQLREQVLTLVRLNRLDGATAAPKGKRLFIIVVAVAGRKFGLIVDRLVGEEELVIKALDNQLVSTDLVSGASILGDGMVVLILNIAAVVERLGRIRGITAGINAAQPPAGIARGAKA